MNEINEINKIVLTDVPKVLENEQIYVYIPIAVGDKPGIIAVPADSKDFEVVDGNLKLKWDIDELLATKLDVPDKGKVSTILTVNDKGIVTYVRYSASQIIVGGYSIPMRTPDGDLLVLDTPTDKRAAVNQKYVDKRDNELDVAIKAKLNISRTPGIVYANTHDGVLSEPTQIPYSSTPDIDGESIVSRTFDGYFDVKDPLQDAQAANKKYADRIFDKGGTIKKDLNVLGDLKVQGNLVYVAGTIEGVEKQFVELNTNKKLVIGQSGLLINKGVTANGDLGTYAIVYDADKDAVVCGLGVTRVDKIDGKDVLVFEFNKGEGLPLAIRDESDKMADGGIIVWDNAEKKLKTAYRRPSDFLQIYGNGQGENTFFPLIVQDADNNVYQSIRTGKYSVGQPGTPYNSKFNNVTVYFPVLRGLDGSLKARPVAGNKSDFDVIVREELNAALDQLKGVIISDETFIVDLDNTTPSDATSGTLTEDQFNILNNNHNVCIKFNNEYYYLADKGHTEGILSYTHQGWNGDAMQDKSINITTNTLAWTLVIGTPNKVIYRHIIQLSKEDNSHFVDAMVLVYSTNSLAVDSLTDLKTLLGSTFKYPANGTVEYASQGSYMAVYITQSKLQTMKAGDTVSLASITFTDTVTPI